MVANTYILGVLIMKVRSFLNGKGFEELTEEELRNFTVEAQVKMLKIAGYTPVEEKNKKKIA